MIKYDVRADGVREMLAQLKEIDPKLVTQFRKELRGTARDMASTIQSRIQVTPPLSGMGGYTPRSLIWQGAKTRVSISMAGSRQRDVTPLLAIKVDSPRGAPGYIAAESAGSKGSSGNTPQGTHFIAMMTQKFGPLKGKGGNRIAWKYFWGQRDLLNRAAGMVVDKFERMVTNEMDR
jgi:nicotinamide mononucleotide (NMN) deamidase PncC